VNPGKRGFTDAPSTVRFSVWSDFLCPWCYVAAARLEAVHREAGDALDIEWRAFLLRPTAEERSRERFTRYTESWARPASMEPQTKFRTWSGEHPPPSHSMPSAIAGKAVLHAFGRDPFDRFHLALMRAYFEENRTISQRDVILDVASTVDIDAAALGAQLGERSAEFEAEVVADHKAALAQGIAAVPTVLVNDEYVLSGAMTVEQYLRVVSRLAS
jgi:predicted DsbA family dithiol-disulfide isomerase